MPSSTGIVVGAAAWDVEVQVHEPTGTAYVSTAEGLAVVDLQDRERTALVPYLDQPATAEHGEYRPGGMGLVSPDGTRAYVAVSRTVRPVREVFDRSTC